MHTKTGLVEYIRNECGGGCTLQHLWGKGYFTSFVDEVIAEGDLEYVYFTDSVQSYVEKSMGIVDVQLSMKAKIVDMNLTDLENCLQYIEDKLSKYQQSVEKLSQERQLLKESIYKLLGR